MNTYDFYNDYVVGYTEKGFEFKFDKEDYEKIKQYTWVSHNIKNKRLIQSKLPNGKIISIHRIIMNDNRSYIHINNDPLDYRKSNLKDVRGKNGGKFNINGYIQVYLPEHPKATTNGCVYEHILVAEKFLGRPLKDEEVVHHKDKNRSNNSPDNLMVFRTKSDHSAFHQGCAAEQDKNGIWFCPEQKEDSYEGIRYKGKINTCIDCGKRISKDAIRCNACVRKNTRKTIRPSKEELKELIFEKPIIQIGRMFNVSDNAIRKWLKAYELPYKRNDIKNYKLSMCQ